MRTLCFLVALLWSFGLQSQTNANASASASASQNDDAKSVAAIRQEIDVLSQKLNTEANKAQIYAKRGLLYFMNGEYENSIADCDRALELKAADRAQCLFYRGIAKSITGKTYEVPACADLGEAKKLGYQANWASMAGMCGNL